MKRVFSSRFRTAERLEVLKLNCDILIPHIAVAEYNLEHSDYWDRDNADIVGSVRQLSFQAIGQTFEKAGCGIIDANLFVRDKAERFSVYAATTLLTNIAEEIIKDHQLPSKMRADELVRFLGPARIATYKGLWAEDQERSSQLQRPSIGDLLAEIYRHSLRWPCVQKLTECLFNSYCVLFGRQRTRAILDFVGRSQAHCLSLPNKG
jgi:hypothetical protein